MKKEKAIVILRMGEQARWRSGVTVEEEKEAVDMAIEALKEMPVEEYRQRLMEVFNRTEHDELLTYVVMPKEEEFKSLEYILQQYKYEPRLHGEWEALGFQQGYAFCRCSNCHKTMKLHIDSKNEFCCIADIRKKVVSCMYCGSDNRQKEGGEESQT